MPWRSREWDNRLGTYKFLDTRFGNTTWEIVKFKTTDTQVTYSEEHEWLGGSHGRKNVGGPFYTESSYARFSVDNLNWLSGVPGRTYLKCESPAFLGTLGLGSTPLNSTQFGPSTSEVLRNLAGPVVKQMAPTKSEANLAQAIGELRRDGLPSLPSWAVVESRARDFRAYGSEYLNAEFGWVPFVSDIRKACEAVKRSHEILKQLDRDSGRVVRRRRNLPGDDYSYSADEGAFYANPLNADLWNVISRPTRSSTIVRRKRWVVAAYTYYVSPGDTILGKMERYSAQAEKLLGLSLTPETLWELAPWSWAVDWFSNVGNTIATLSDFINFGPALRYAYVMETTIADKTYFADGFVDAGGQPHSFYARYKRVTKVREPATPFTFANVNGPLSDSQLAIVAALGLSNAPAVIRP